MKKTVTLFVSLALLAACATPGKNTAIGAGAGAAGGALVGAGIAAISKGDKSQGAVWGAAAGVLLGGALGNYFDKQAKELAKIADVIKTDNGLDIRLKGDILFDTGSAVLNPEAKTLIANLGKVLTKYPCNNIVVGGFTDSTGSAARNQTLSEQRANAVRNELINNNVRTFTPISAVGFGPSYPVASNDSEAGRQANRRVELKITADKATVESKCKIVG